MSEYKVHRFDLQMTEDAGNLERFLNDLDGEVVSIVPHVTMKAFWVHVVDFLYVIEKLPAKITSGV
ncbi:MAG: hypothetical protein WCE80_14575 [Acidimicrobiia bacterium]